VPKQVPLPAWARRRSLRVRLIGAAALAIFVAVAALGASSVVIVDRQLRSSLDTALRQRAEDVSRLSVSAPALLTAPGTLDAPQGGRQLAVEVVDRRGRILARSSSLGGLLLPGGKPLAQALSGGRSRYTDTSLSGDAVRLYVAPLANAGGPAGAGAVLVASSTSEIDETLRRLSRLIAVSALVAAILGAAAAAALTGRGLRPLRRLSQAAGRIEHTGDAAARLPEPATDDELAELAGTLNRMLAALERARETERRFLADASHELRTPLTSLRGNAAYLARHGADPGAMADLEADAARLGRLLDDLLALEREQAFAPVSGPVPLEELVRQAAEREPRVIVGACDAVSVAGERAALERALDNLIVNARVHGPPDGRIDVGLTALDGRARLSVSDEGPGLTPTDAARAFGRFWRGEPAGERPGTGLGLSIVKATAERHGGRVSVEGSRFTLDLPALVRPG
jgi:signal transduction histidine kinase